MQIGALFVKIGADTGELRRKLGETSRDLKTQASELRAGVNTWAKWGAAATAAAVAASAAIVRSQVSTIDSLAKMGDRLGIATDQLQGLQFAAEQNDVAINQLNLGIQRMTRRVAEAAKGTGEAVAALKELGLDAKELSRLTPDQMLRRVADAMQGVTGPADRVRLAFKLFDSEGVALVNMLRDGAEGLDAFQAEAESLGLTISRLDAAQVEEAADAMNRISKVTQGIAQRATIELAPVIVGVSNSMLEAAKNSDTFGNEFGGAAQKITTAIGFIADAFRGLHVLVKGVEVAWLSLKVVVLRAMQAIPHTIELAINAALGAVNELISGINRIPGVDIPKIEPVVLESVRALGMWISDAKDEAAEARGELYDLANQPMPSDNIRRFVEEAVEASRQAAQEAKNAVGQVVEAGPTFAFTPEQNEEFLEGLRERFSTEAELQAEKFAGDLARLQEARLQELLTDAEFNRRSEQLAADHAEKMAAIQETQRKARVGIVASMMDNLSQLMNSGSRTQFEIGKTAAIASALVKGYEAVVSSYAAGAKIGGPVLGAAYAATAAVATAAQIGQIRKTQFGSASGSVSYSGGQAVAQTATPQQSGPVQPEQPSRVIDLAVRGRFFTAEDVRELIGEINSQVGDGVILRTS